VTPASLAAIHDIPHPQGIDPTTAEVWRVMWLELTFGKAEGETTIDVCARVAASLGARAARSRELARRITASSTKEAERRRVLGPIDDVEEI
jgi:hypothetical protein